MVEVKHGSIRIRVLECIPLNISDYPKHYLLSFQIVDGTLKLPPCHKVITERDDIRKILEKEIEVYMQLRDFARSMFYGATR